MNASHDLQYCQAPNPQKLIGMDLLSFMHYIFCNKVGARMNGPTFGLFEFFL
jgi:hypothetical protein